MFSFPFYFILIAYFLYLAIFLIFSAANVYHIYSTGTFTMPAIIVTSITSILCILILALTFTNLIGINWDTLIVFLGPSGDLITFE